MKYFENMQNHTQRRLAVGAALALPLTMALIWTMYTAIAQEEMAAIEVKPAPNLRFVELPEEYEVDDEVPPPQPPPMVEPPPPVPKPAPDQEYVGTTPLVFNPPPRNSVTPTASGVADGTVTPILTVAPEYPQRALARGTEGWVLVQFNVDELGRVAEPSVVDAQPLQVFDKIYLKINKLINS